MKTVPPPSDAYYIIFESDGFFLCPDPSFNIVRSIKKFREIDEYNEIAKILEEIRKSDVYIATEMCMKIRGHMFIPIYTEIVHEDIFEQRACIIGVLFPEIKTFDDFVKHNKKLAKQALDKLFGEDLCYIVVDPRKSNGDFLTCKALIPANNTDNDYTAGAIKFFENVLENGYYKRK